MIKSILVMIYDNNHICPSFLNTSILRAQRAIVFYRVLKGFLSCLGGQGACLRPNMVLVIFYNIVADRKCTFLFSSARRFQEFSVLMFICGLYLLVLVCLLLGFLLCLGGQGACHKIPSW